MLNLKKLKQDSLSLVDFWQQQVESSTKGRFNRQLQKEERELSSLVSSQKSKNIVISLLDQSFRSNHSSRVVEQFCYLLKKYGIPQSFFVVDRFLLKFFIFFHQIVPFSSLFLSFFLKKFIFTKTKKVVLNNEEKKIGQHLYLRKKKKIINNINLLGELILGEQEAQQRLEEYVLLLQKKEVNYISVKVSSIYSQLHPLSHEHSKQILRKRLSKLYQISLQFKDKFINLDMEEYKDLELTLEVFMETLMQKKFLSVYAGIVLQAYLPDAFGCYKKLLKWTKERIKKGGGPIKVRVVKGANMEMERVESSLHGWQMPIFPTKVETDANYKKIIHLAIKPENIKKIHLGIASHNLFDIAYIETLRKHYKVEQYSNFEMLEGIAERSREVIGQNKELILYTPIAKQKEFINAISYLIRRLDENTAKDNFLKYSFNLKINSQNWLFLKNNFLKSISLIDKIKNTPFREKEEKQLPKHQWQIPQQMNSDENFINEKETNFYLAKNLLQAEKIKKKWQSRFLKSYQMIPVYLANKIIQNSNLKTIDYYNPNQDKQKLDKQKLIYKVCLSSKKHIEKNISYAEKGFLAWSKLSWQQRAKLICKAGNIIRNKRYDLMACMALVTGKPFLEGDNEITEAIDFSEYYPYSIKKLHEQVDMKTTGKGVALVITPWNFPTAIPAGGIIASLMAGNSVILKPAEQAMPIAVELVKCFWEAGISKEVLQIVNCQQGENLDYLVQNSSIATIIFTGSTETLLKIKNNNSNAFISAETGGKNAMIVSSMADRDQAIKNIIHSAFSNSGQKCSAASLLILEKELFHCEDFKQKLKDACESLEVGSAFDFKNSIGAMISTPTKKLKRAMILEKGEQWLVPPKFNNKNKKIFFPAVKWNVKKKSFCYKNELFAPLLSVMYAKNFKDALSKVNNEYGLTSGLESLDEREIQKWKKTIKAGNLYINRGITGAIVGRQPFGGFLNSKSAYGTGFKAGGMNYLIQFMNIEKIKKRKRKNVLENFLQKKIFHKIKDLLQNYQWWLAHHFSVRHHSKKVYGQDNYFHYLQGEKPFLLRIKKGDSLENILLVCACAYFSKNKILISVDEEFVQENLIFIEELKKIIQYFNKHFGKGKKWNLKIERLENLCSRIQKLQEKEVSFIRTIGKIKDFDFKKSCASVGLSIFSHLPYEEGRLELPYYFQEQSISENYHRYGNLIFRG